MMLKCSCLPALAAPASRKWKNCLEPRGGRGRPELASGRSFRLEEDVRTYYSIRAVSVRMTYCAKYVQVQGTLRRASIDPLVLLHALQPTVLVLYTRSADFFTFSTGIFRSCLYPSGLSARKLSCPRHHVEESGRESWQCQLADGHQIAR